MIPFGPVPTLDFGLFSVHTFGLAVAAGVLLALRILSAEEWRHRLEPGLLTGLAITLVGVGLVGARAAFVMSHPGQFSSRPLAVLAVWEGGLQFFGGFVAAGAYLWRWLRRHPELSTRALADALTVALVAGMAVGRVGCLLVGEHLGGPTAFPLGIRYLGGDTIEGPLRPGDTVHSTALYEVFGLVLLLGVLLCLRRRLVPLGAMTVVAGLWYGVQRFATDVLREYDQRFGGLTGAQFACLGLIAVAAWGVGRLRSGAHVGRVTEART